MHDTGSEDSYISLAVIVGGVVIIAVVAAGGIYLYKAYKKKIGRVWGGGMELPLIKNAPGSGALGTPTFEEIK